MNGLWAQWWVELPWKEIASSQIPLFSQATNWLCFFEPALTMGRITHLVMRGQQGRQILDPLITLWNRGCPPCPGLLNYLWIAIWGRNQLLSYMSHHILGFLFQQLIPFPCLYKKENENIKKLNFFTFYDLKNVSLFLQILSLMVSIIKNLKFNWLQARKTLKLYVTSVIQHASPFFQKISLQNIIRYTLWA